jgi:hypothetical protein
LAARFLPTERAQVTLTLRVDPERLLTEARDFLRHHGRLSDDEQSAHSPHPSLTGVIGSGLLNLNPAIVCAEIVAADETGCTVVLTAAAKEGLIKQRTAKKALARLTAALRASSEPM